jgi:hypothetical protein
MIRSDVDSYSTNFSALIPFRKTREKAQRYAVLSAPALLLSEPASVHSPEMISSG